MQVLVTGADGFIGKNLTARLKQAGIGVLSITRDSSGADIKKAAARADAAVHLAAIIRPQPGESFGENASAADQLVEALKPKKTPVLYTSSTQITSGTEYGTSKRVAEDALAAYGRETGAPVYIYRLPNVFGRWARPNFNSAVATFCHRIARDEPIEIHDPNTIVTLVYIDDVTEAFLAALEGKAKPGILEVSPTYTISVGDMAAQIRAFHEGKQTALPGVDPALARALHETYLSAQPEKNYAQHA